MTQEQIEKILKSSLLKADHEFEQPPVCLEIDGEYGKQIFATLGNFSVMLASPKVGKTTATAIFASSYLSGKTILNIVPNYAEE
jgi:hypothetical protein